MSSPIRNTLNFNYYNPIKAEKCTGRGRPNNSLQNVFKTADFLSREITEVGRHLREEAWNGPELTEKASKEGVTLLKRNELKRSLAHIMKCNSHSNETKIQARRYLEQLVRPAKGRTIDDIIANIWCRECKKAPEPLHTVDEKNNVEFDLMEVDLELPPVTNEKNSMVIDEKEVEEFIISLNRNSEDQRETLEVDRNMNEFSFNEEDEYASVILAKMTDNPKTVPLEQPKLILKFKFRSPGFTYLNNS